MGSESDRVPMAFDLTNPLQGLEVWHVLSFNSFKVPLYTALGINPAASLVSEACVLW